MKNTANKIEYNRALQIIEERDEEIKKLRKVIDEITRNAIEIERLLCEEVAEAGVLAIKEFAKRLKERVIPPDEPWDEPMVCEFQIDNLVKEMMGEG